MDDVERVISTMSRTARNAWPYMTTLPAACATTVATLLRVMYVCGKGSDNKMTYINCSLFNACACNHMEKNVMVHAMAWLLTCLTLVCVGGYAVNTIKRIKSRASNPVASSAESTVLPKGHYRCDYGQVIAGYENREYRCKRCGPDMVAYEMCLHDTDLMGPIVQPLSFQQSFNVATSQPNPRHSSNISVRLKHKRIYLCAEHAVRCPTLVRWYKVHVNDAFEAVDIENQ